MEADGAVARRPRKRDDQNPKRANLTLRIRSADREALQAAADENGRSLSEEAEARIIGSLVLDVLAARLDILDERIAQLVLRSQGAS